MLGSNISIIKYSLVLMLSVLTACGGGGSGDKKEDKPMGDKSVPTQPQNVSILAGDTQVSLSWDNVSDATAYDICSATETITQPANCSIHQNGALAVDQTSPAVINSLTNNTQYFFVIIPKNANGDGVASMIVSAIPVGVVVPTSTGKFNDTGITLCSDYADGSSGTSYNNDLDCSNAFDNEGNPIPPGQDALFGRDADPANNDDSDGHKGFSFTKLDGNGFALSDQSATTFSCVKDNVTDLIWEVKQTAAGLHNKDDIYTWLNTDATNNGGNNGTVNANASCEGNTNIVCNTQEYTARVNIASLCGAKNWRLPTRKELRSIVHYDRFSPAIDTTYFPNTNSAFYWSSSPQGSFRGGTVWGVGFKDGFDGRGGGNFSFHVRLVRSGQ